MLSIYYLVLSQIYFSLFLNAFIQKVRERKGVQQGLTSIFILRAKEQNFGMNEMGTTPGRDIIKKSQSGNSMKPMWLPLFIIS